MQAVHKQELKMIEAAEHLGVTYSILYSKYREAFGKLLDKSEEPKCLKSDNAQDQKESARKRRGQKLQQTKKKKRKIQAESDDDDEYVPSDAEKDDFKQEECPLEDVDDLAMEDRETKQLSSSEKREKRKYSKRRIPIPTAEELLSQETDREVIRLQKQFSAQDVNWWEPPKPYSAERTQTALREHSHMTSAMEEGGSLRSKGSKGGCVILVA